MAAPVVITAKKARKLIYNALTGADTLPRNATYFTEAILDTELSSLEGHGFCWLQYYCEHVRSGKVDGKARPSVKMISPAALRVNANGGFAHPAIEPGLQIERELLARPENYSAASLGNSSRAARKAASS
jgi:(2R)-3-sulfolactate dehydrogenase (NADP+)